MYVTALVQYSQRVGSPDVPALHIEIVDGREVRLGAWVGYIRQRQRAGKLPADRVAALEQVPGWQWGPLKPGPRTNKERNSRIMARRAAGESLQQIADSVGLSRQRIHQIVADRVEERVGVGNFPF